MTQEEKRIAIAEKCGWIKAYEEGEDEGTGSWFWHKGGYNLKRPPNYPYDLNACHEMMQWAKNDGMNSDQWEEFGKQIIKTHPHVCATEHPYDLATLIADTTASNLCEAFGKTLGLW